MPDEIKKFLSRELEELRQNKIRAGALVVCVIFLLIYCFMDNSSRGEEIPLNEPTAINAPPATKDLPAKPLPVTKTSDGVTLVMGANADALTVADPFAVEEKKNSATPSTKISKPVAPITTQPPTIPKAQEKIILTGTAISSDRKTAMFLRGKETVFLSIGEELNGRKIVDITPDFVTFADGSRMYVDN